MRIALSCPEAHDRGSHKKGKPESLTPWPGRDSGSSETRSKAEGDSAAMLNWLYKPVFPFGKWESCSPLSVNYNAECKYLFA